MRKYTYENHVIAQPLLPFIFHKEHSVSKRNNTVNWHANIELLYCISGSGFVRCGSTDTEFTPGDIFVVNPDIPHSIGSKADVHYRCLIIDNRFLNENGFPAGALQFQPLIQDKELCLLFDAVTQGYEHIHDGSPCAVADIRSAVLSLLCRLCRLYATVGKEDDRSDAYVKKVIHYIRQDLSSPITLDELADYAGISKYHLCRQFKAYTGSTVIATINLIRCTQARRLIESGKPVSEAAAACGYENLSYFTRVFKKHLHALPSSFLPSR